MKNLFLLACALLPTLAQAAEIPFSPEVEQRLNGSRVNYAYDLKHVARGVYDASVQGGTCATDYTLLTMPANAVVTSMYFYFDQRFAVTGGSLLSKTHVFCGTYGTGGYTFLDGVQLDQGGGGIGVTGAVLAGPAGYSAGAIAGAGQSYLALSGVPCDVKVRTNGGGTSPGGSGTTTVGSGKFDLYLEYILKSAS